MEAQLEAVFSLWSAPRLYYAIDSSKQFSFKLSVLSAVVSKQTTRKEAPVQRDKEDNRTSDCDELMTVIVIVKVSANKTNIF
jgi:hypothetical protein